ncbi:MAG: PVC-type heme-binding CxxCH protein, partial [Opitutaceae bacterium]
MVVVTVAGAVVIAATAPTKSNTSAARPGRPDTAPPALDPVRDLPRHPPVEPRDALSTWEVKRGFKLELAAHEPQVRDPIAISFDENGRMFVCEMIDYPGQRDVDPHLGRISLLEDEDGDGFYETSKVFADDLPWPTGLIWANGGLFVGATPDIWRFEDHDGDGRAEVREKIFTGFGSGFPRLNVQRLLNCFTWGQDNRVHVQTAGGTRGKVRCLKRPDLQASKLGGRDFWFDPVTCDFGVEAGGAQYGMSFDNYGRKFGCSNSDHLQFFVYDDRYAARNPFFEMPPSRQSIAADGPAAEVFRISPDEPWRIIRTRWRVGGVVSGVIEGGGRVSGYFTGASGTTVYRGDAYGPGFTGNTFTGDAGGQLIHRKKLYRDGVSFIGRRPEDEQSFEFAASTDTWVRIVNFANAPDGTLHVCDMYREVIEHPWSIPEEIKQHLDLRNGSKRGRIYRLVRTDAAWERRKRVQLGSASTEELVATLEHANGWHRDTASRLLYERQDRTAAPLLAKLVRESHSPLAKYHALGVLEGLGGLDGQTVLIALRDADENLRERGIVMAEKLIGRGIVDSELVAALAALADDPCERVRFQLAFTLGTVLATKKNSGLMKPLAAACARLAKHDWDDKWLSAALLSGPPEVVTGILFPAMTRDLARAEKAAPFVARLIEIRAASQPAECDALIDFVAKNLEDPISVIVHDDSGAAQRRPGGSAEAPKSGALWLRALGDGLRRAGSSIEQADSAHKLASVFSRAASTAADREAAPAARLGAIGILDAASYARARDALLACLGPAQLESVQAAAIETLAQHARPEVGAALLESWPHYGKKSRQAALAALMAREDRAIALLEAIRGGAIDPIVLSAAQVQALSHHANAKLAALAKSILAPVIPSSHEEVIAKFQPAVGLRGDAGRGRDLFRGRCAMCHRADGEGVALGPDLTTVKSTGRDGLLVAILAPNKEVAPQYIAYNITTKDGNGHIGVIQRDDASGVTLKIMGGAEVAIPRRDIESSTSAGESLMPEGLAAGMDEQD